MIWKPIKITYLSFSKYLPSPFLLGTSAPESGDTKRRRQTLLSRKVLRRCEIHTHLIPRHGTSVGPWPRSRSRPCSNAPAGSQNSALVRSPLGFLVWWASRGGRGAAVLRSLSQSPVPALRRILGIFSEGITRRRAPCVRITSSWARGRPFCSLSLLTCVGTGLSSGAHAADRGPWAVKSFTLCVGKETAEGTMWPMWRTDVQWEMTCHRVHREPPEQREALGRINSRLSM